MSNGPTDCWILMFFNNDFSQSLCYKMVTILFFSKGVIEMKCIKRSFLYFFMFTMVLLNNSFSLQAMKRLREPRAVAVIDWEYKQRENKGLCYFDDKDGPEYPFFLFNKSNANVKISDEKIAKKYNKIFGSICAVSSLNEENKKTLWYVLESIKKDKKLRIEGGNKNFAKEMSQRVLNLPLKIRQEIAEKYGETMMSNTHCEPSRLGALLDSKSHKQQLAIAVADCGGYICCSLQYCLWYALGLSLPFKCICAPIVISLGCCCYSYKKIDGLLQETPEKRDKRQGFVAISLLKEMEYEIVDSKEKITM